MSPTPAPSTSASRAAPRRACRSPRSTTPATSASPARRTRQNKVTPDELSGGTFTITNYGSAGTLMDTPIINQPQVAILGTGALVKRPVVVTDKQLGEVIAVRDMMYLSMSYDHRLVDGADAARFLSTLKARLEEGDFGSEFGL